jgi:hypothetical protein
MINVALGLVLGFSTLFYSNSLQEYRARVAGWTIDIRKDKFTGRQTCSLHRDGMHYERRSVVFRLPGLPDTTRAAYRIDNGPAFPVAADQATFARLGFTLQSEDLMNPTGGVVRITVDRLGAARRVDIEARPYGSRRRYRLDGFAKALARASTWCAEADYTRPTEFDDKP